MRAVGFTGLMWALALCGALGLSYWASLPQAETAGKFFSQQLDVAKIEQIELISSKATFTAFKNSDQLGRWWIEILRKSLKDKVGGEIEQGPVRFLASERFNEYLQELSKLPVIRDIGVVAEDRLNEFGLREPDGTLVIKNSGTELSVELLVGKQLFGSQSIYIMRKSDNRILLVDADLITDLTNPESRFFERRVVDSPIQEAEVIVVSSADKQVKMRRSKQDANGVVQWVSSLDLSKDIEGAGAWVEQLARLKAAKYADKATQDKLVGSPTVFEAVVTYAEGRSRKIEVRQVKNGSDSEFYVWSDFLQCHVKVATALTENLIKELPQIFRG